jgi:hypothetical protein
MNELKQLNDLFKEVVADVLPNHSYIFDRWSNAAEKVHTTDMPAVIHVIPKRQQYTLNTQQTKIGTTTSCLVAFFDLCPSLDADGEEMAEVLDRCQEAAQRFFSALTYRNGIAIVGDVNVETAEASYSACLAGVVCEFRIKAKDKAICGVIQ